VTRERDVARIRTAVALLRDAERPVRILRGVAWAPSVRAGFFAAGGRELPAVTYAGFDAAPTLERTAAARDMATGTSDVDAWLRRQADAIDAGARMLAAVGTPDFYRRSAEIYGSPTSPLADQVSSSLDLARALDRTIEGLRGVDLGPETQSTADEVAARVTRAVARHFGAASPAVEVVDELSANALAGVDRIRLRRSARFTDRDAVQLVQHEAYVHVGTSLSGRCQDQLPILAAGHPGTTRTQEGLAVFAELISGALDPDRLDRLADRVLAIQMAIDGADFLQVFAFFAERTHDREQAFENARRVFRGGVLTGGAPFTKDVVYLDGLLRVHNFLRAAVAGGRTDCLRLLFAGKLDIEDVPALCHLAEMGLLRRPAYLPPWALDLRFLVSYLAYSAFLNQVELHTIRAHYGELLADAPPVAFAPVSPLTASEQRDKS
jgi:uncharacterized protein (TIGR02421 family)